VGFGSYHWIVDSSQGSRFFVTIDDLNHKAWLGDTPDSVFDGLRRAFDTALALRREGGLRFVIAPLPTVERETVRRIGGRYAISLFPYVQGAAGRFGGERRSIEHGEVLDVLVKLHGATASLPTTPRREIGLPARSSLEEALAESDGEWRGGPFAEPARKWLASHSSDLRRRLKDFDRLVEAVTAAGNELVVTHGETHPGNFMRSDEQLVLVDWDTVALAPPERDLWQLATAEGDRLAGYTAATGREVDQAAMSLYRLGWDLKDAAEYIDLFRSEHRRTADTEKAWRGLTRSWLADG
jgi:spectinomycin phosphotransferase